MNQITISRIIFKYVKQKSSYSYILWKFIPKVNLEDLKQTYLKLSLFDLQNCNN
jgi:hypothetical protein